MQRNVINKQLVVAIFSVAALAMAAPVQGADADGNAGFYGGVSMRDGAAQSFGVQTGAMASSWTRSATPTVEDTSITRSLVFGGYRWRNDVAVEASFSSFDKYALRPTDTAPLRGGVGLGIASGTPGIPDTALRSWNVDVYTSWAFYKAFALYGRLGYAQSDALPQLAGTNPGWSLDPRRLRDGVNYGVGLRYDMTRDLGLRLEYARFGRYAPDLSGALPESDQVTFGVQFRF